MHVNINKRTKWISNCVKEILKYMYNYKRCVTIHLVIWKYMYNSFQVIKTERMSFKN